MGMLVKTVIVMMDCMGGTVTEGKMKKQKILDVAQRKELLQGKGRASYHIYQWWKSQ